jgi:RimJ/RimL family protein N-acetyltransferase
MTTTPIEVPAAPPTLAGAHVRLEPLTLAHVPALVEVGLDPELWQLTVNQVRSPADMQRYVETALGEQAAGRALPFATVDAASGRVVGSTRLGSIDAGNRRVEIGWTWLAPAWQRTALNTEAKLLLLEYAFDGLGCIRVELKTDVLNERSRAAILRLGAVEEGVLRSHQITTSGRVRDTVYFSILAAEWPAVRAGLKLKLERRTRE